MGSKEYIEREKEREGCFDRRVPWRKGVGENIVAGVLKVG